MDSQKTLRFFQNPFYLPHFLPAGLKKEKQFQLTYHSFKKHEIEVEYDYLNFVQDHFVSSFFTLIENRFWLYERKPFVKKEEYSSVFQTLDFSDKSFQFSQRKQKLKNQVSFSKSLLVRSNWLKNRTNNSQLIVKGRILSLTKGGFKVSCLGTHGFLLRSSFFFRKKRLFSYQSWFLLNLSFFGKLKAFKILNWRVKAFLIKKKLQRRFFSKKLRFYYGRRQNLQSFITLSKLSLN